MRFHLDTSFLIDWQRGDPAVESLVEGILAGDHQISIDAVAHTEFVTAALISARKQIVLDVLDAVSAWTDIPQTASERAARWLTPMDLKQRCAFFADAMIAAVAADLNATLLTGDRKSGRAFPVATELYR